MNSLPTLSDATQVVLSFYEDLWQDVPAGAPFDQASMDVQHAGYRTLAIQAFAAAEAQAQALSTASRRSWRVMLVECLCPRAFPIANVRRTKAGAAEPESGVASQTSTLRLSLLARISLACSNAVSE